MPSQPEVYRWQPPGAGQAAAGALMFDAAISRAEDFMAHHQSHAVGLVGSHSAPRQQRQAYRPSCFKQLAGQALVRQILGLVNKRVCAHCYVQCSSELERARPRAGMYDSH